MTSKSTILCRMHSLPNRVRSAFRRAKKTLQYAGNRDFLLLNWLEDGVVGQNWGDKLNPVLVRILSQKQIVNRRKIFNAFRQPVYYVIGSGLGAISDSRSSVWGMGFNKFNDRILMKPKDIHAVRGPLSQEKLIQAGVACPSVFGDPALLLPWFFNPPQDKKYELGLIPHFSHRQASFFSGMCREDVLVIDITGDIEDVVRQVKSCKLISSSSLHGLIIADAYGIPCKWCHIESNPIGDGFKFRDHNAAVQRAVDIPLSIKNTTTIEEVTDSFSDYKPPRLPDLSRLLECCPFLAPELRHCEMNAFPQFWSP